MSIELLALCAYSTVFLSAWWLAARLEVIPGVASWFVPAGVRFLALLIFPPRHWWRLWIVEVVSIHLVHEVAYDYFVLLRAIGGSVLPFLCFALPAFLFRRWARAASGLSISYVARATIAAVMGAVINGVFLANNRYMNNMVSEEERLTAWAATVLGDMVGVMLAAAFAGVWYGVSVRRFDQLFARAAWLFIPLSALAIVWLFPDPFHKYTYYFQLLALFPMVAGALAGGVWGVSLVLLTTSSVLVFGQVIDAPFNTMSDDQFYILATSFAGFALGTATDEQRHLNAMLAAQNDKLLQLIDDLNLINRDYEDLANRLMNAEERERSRISRDLHDGLGQLLSAARMQLKVAQSLNGEPFKRNQAIGDAEDIIDRAYETVREVMQQLAPASLRRNGFQSAIADAEIARHARSVGLRYVTEIDFDVDQLSESAALNLFRIVQECVNNTIKHAAASAFTVSLKARDDVLILSVRDDGRGFDPATVARGMGLKNVRDRVAALGGQHRLESNKFGTLHCCEFPLDKLVADEENLMEDIPRIKLA
ncbi:MAG: histidine kinase [Halieaceae bacterium]|nr:histidine kinase [Halieaceae bacterium]